MFGIELGLRLSSIIKKLLNWRWYNRCEMKGTDIFCQCL